MRARIPGLILAALFTTLAVAAPLARADVGVSVWSPGDSWEWQGSLGANGPFLLKLTIVGQDGIVTSGTNYTAYHAKLWNNFTSGAPNTSMTGDIWYRVSDLAVLRCVMQFNVTGPGVAWNIDMIEYAPPLPLQFPLATNETWVAVTTASVFTISPVQPATWDNQTLGTTYRVGPPLQFTDSAGTFMTAPIYASFTTSSGQGNEVYYWSADAGNSVNGPLIAPGVLDFGPMQLTSYTYTPPAGPSNGGAAFPVWTFLGGVAVGAMVVAAIAGILVVRSRGRRTVKPLSPASPPPPPNP